MTEQDKASGEKADCGIVMPISEIDDCLQSGWRRALIGGMFWRLLKMQLKASGLKQVWLAKQIMPNISLINREFYIFRQPLQTWLKKLAFR